MYITKVMKSCYIQIIYKKENKPLKNICTLSSILIDKLFVIAIPNRIAKLKLIKVPINTYYVLFDALYLRIRYRFDNTLYI